MTEATAGTATTQPRKKRRIFLWVFMAIQALFVAWIIAGISSGSGNTSDAENVGTGIGVFLIVVVWMIVDFLLAVIYGIYRLAKRT